MLSLNLNQKNKEELYKSLIPIFKSLIDDEKEWISLLSNFSAVLKQSFDTFSWVGFYLLKDGRLILGPFQGKVACSLIEIGKGVCGTAFKERRTIVVEDVDKFPGHIACDENSRSEIVVPVFLDEEVIGVLDIDSYNYSNFDKIDQKYLEELVSILSKKLKELNFKLL
ncbi:MAG: GAF domain-containing protein [Ignavibacteria bacterium]|nr:GAF domain-containing protein [Ignavibacteria bacterium]MDH7528330.1 GAF domain-containing protein [Ignavibacteria bacterium]